MICSRVIIFFCRVSNVARGFPVPSGYTAQKMARQGACDVVQMHDCSGHMVMNLALVHVPEAIHHNRARRPNKCTGRELEPKTDRSGKELAEKKRGEMKQNEANLAYLGHQYSTAESRGAKILSLFGQNLRRNAVEFFSRETSESVQMDELFKSLMCSM